MSAGRPGDGGPRPPEESTPYTQRLPVPPRPRSSPHGAFVAVGFVSAIAVGGLALVLSSLGDTVAAMFGTLLLAAVLLGAIGAFVGGVVTGDSRLLGLGVGALIVPALGALGALLLFGTCLLSLRPG